MPGELITQRLKQDILRYTNICVKSIQLRLHISSVILLEFLQQNFNSISDSMQIELIGVDYVI